MQPGDRLEEFRALRYELATDVAGSADRLLGRLTVIDTDIKPADRLPQYAGTLKEYCNHPHVGHLLQCLRAGQPLDKSLSGVQSFLDSSIHPLDAAVAKKDRYHNVYCTATAVQRAADRCAQQRMLAS